MRQDPSPCHRSVLSHRDTLILLTTSLCGLVSAHCDFIRTFFLLRLDVAQHSCSPLLQHIHCDAIVHSSLNMPNLSMKTLLNLLDVFFWFFIINVLGVFRCLGTQ